jgi:hypothetical protein
MSFDADRLYALLPAIYRIRDAEQGEPLRALLAIAARQAVVLEENLEQLHDDLFVETCAPWVLPYIGDLLGITGLPGEALNPRAEVAHTIGYRRRKGTAAMLEQLAGDVTGLSARAVEFFQILATTQYLNHRRPENRSFLSVRGATGLEASVRGATRLERLGGPFEHLEGEVDLTHTAEVRRIARGRYNIPNVGIFLWRLQAYRLTDSPAVPETSNPQRRFRFSPLGNDVQLFNLPRTEDETAHLAEPVNVPEPIGRRVMDALPADYYGPGRSIQVEAAAGDVPLDQVVVCDLSAWSEPADRVALDPVLGRIAFPAEQAAAPLVTFHYGFSADLGGGEYSRGIPAEPRLALRRVAMDGSEDFTVIQAALDGLGPEGGVVEVMDSGRYVEALGIDAVGRQVTLRAAEGVRPTVVLTGEMRLTGRVGDSVTLDGLLLSGAAVVADGAGGGLGLLRIRHCTLVPGISLDAAGAPTQGAAPGLVIEAPNCSVEVEASIVGAVRAVTDTRMRISGSIVDATEPDNPAYDAPAGSTIPFGGALRVENSTLIGRVRADALVLASNTIFLAGAPEPVVVRRRQEGCVRFSYVPPGSRTPRRYRCQPQTEADAARVRPMFTSARYGAPGYVQLAADTPGEIRRGADDESEMGAFHDLYLPLREAHLRTRLDESLRFGLGAGIFYAT